MSVGIGLITGSVNKDVGVKRRARSTLQWRLAAIVHCISFLLGEQIRIILLRGRVLSLVCILSLGYVLMCPSRSLHRLVVNAT